ncbi:MAG: nitroreductase, partial [Fibrobacter sp.]|nr:nitroreductase [Fibrobacter sp.]
MKRILYVSIIGAAALLLSCDTGKKATDSEVVNKVILSRHSIRKYKERQVPKDTLDIIIKAGINAPSAKNNQPWEVRVIQNQDLLEKIKATGGSFHNAPSLIVIANDTANPYGEFDCGLLSQNIMLSAESFNLGTCALGNLARAINNNTPEAAEVRKELNFSPGYK